jgi:simple sugar transport system ATP-binding protein
MQATTRTEPQSALASVDAVIEMRGVNKYFGRTHALRDINLKIPKQKVVGLVGDNGAGKSTLIKVITGIHTLEEGEYLFDGKAVKLKSPADARSHGIETVYQDLALVDDLSIAHNFFLGSEPSWKLGPFKFLDHKRMREESRASLENMGIHVRDTAEKVATLSGGERQAVAIGRSLHFGKKLLILDEPTSALSLKETQKVLGYMRTARDKGMTILFVTHNLYDMLDVCDHFVVLNLGKVVAQLTRAEASFEILSKLIRGKE